MLFMVYSPFYNSVYSNLFAISGILVIFYCLPYFTWFYSWLLLFWHFWDVLFVIVLFVFVLFVISGMSFVVCCYSWLSVFFCLFSLFQCIFFQGYCHFWMILIVDYLQYLMIFIIGCSLGNVCHFNYYLCRLFDIREMLFYIS
jgi:hypothetical protein